MTDDRPTPPMVFRDERQTSKSLRDFYREWWSRAGIGIPDEYQMKILMHPGSLIVNKARQTGVSTTVACLAVQTAALGNKSVLIMSEDAPKSRELVKVYCPPFIRGLGDLVDRPTTDQSELVRWPGGGWIRSLPASPEAARGYPADLAILDEAAHFTREMGLDRAVWQALVPTTAAKHGRIVVLSTPNGMGNVFEDEYHKAERGQGMPYIKIHWSECPRLVGMIRLEERFGDTIYWVGETPFTESDFQQEFCNRFDVSANEAIPLKAIWAAEDPTVDTWVLRLPGDV